MNEMSPVNGIKCRDQRISRTGILVSLMLLVANGHFAQTLCTPNSRERNNRATGIAIDSKSIQSGVQRLGISIPAQNFWDSGQILRNLVFRNPGFEGEIWQSILRCRSASKISCTYENEGGKWPPNFLDGGEYEFISGATRGERGKITMSAAAEATVGQRDTINFTPLPKPPAAGDFVIVRKTIRGDAQAGWWTDPSEGQGIFSTELSDLPPETQGKQALRIETGPGRSTSLSSYFDSSPGRSFLRLKGEYRLRFRAKGIGGNDEIRVLIMRQSKSPTYFLSKEIKLSNRWNDYHCEFSANESGDERGSLALKFEVSGASLLMDDVSLSAISEGNGNRTAFRDEVVRALEELHPGVLRYNDEAAMGSTIDNLIAPAFARQRAGASIGRSAAEDVAIGLHEFLQLCEVVGADPYFNMPPGMDVAEAKHLIEYLAGAPATPYGAKRAARGQREPWTSVFHVIHLELGNEEWNSIFSGTSMNDGPSYGQRAREIFMAARSAPGYDPVRFDLVIGGQAVNTSLTSRELENSDAYDSISFAPYLFTRFDDARSDEAIFGPMLAQPEMIDRLPMGYMAQQVKLAREAKRPAKVVVYETNLHTTAGAADQIGFDKAIPSLGAGLAVVEHMLLMMGDLGIKTQALWGLTGYKNTLKNSSTGQDQSTPLFGAVVDMGGPTNLRRPQFLAEQLANKAILPTMLGVKMTGSNPTWHQEKSKNDDIQINEAHYLLAFAFSEGTRRSVIIFNLSRTEALPVVFPGGNAPKGTVEVSRLSSSFITDTNESKVMVGITESRMNAFNPTAPYTLPPHSMTVLQWIAAH